MTVKAEVVTGQLAKLIKEVEVGNEVVLTQGNKPVAKLVSAIEREVVSGDGFRIRSLKGHRVLTPVITQADLAEEMFDGITEGGRN